MKRFVGLALAIATALMLVLAGTAFAANVTQLSIAQIRQDSGNLYLYLTGVNDRGEAALDTASIPDYAVEMNGAPLQISDVSPFSAAMGKVHYIVCVDISGSIKKQEGECIGEALRDMISGMNDNEYITLYTFGNESKRAVHDKPKDSNSLAERVNGLQFKDGKTALYQVIDESTKFAWENEKGYTRTAVLIITDGTDDPNGGAKSYSYDTIREDVRMRNVPVYIASFYRGDQSDGTESLNQLRELASISGGFAISLARDDDSHEMTKKMSNIVGITRQSTRLTASLVSDMERGNGNFKASKNNNGKILTTPEHFFEVNWNSVPEPTPEPDTTLERLEVGSVTEDSTSIHIVAEPEASFTIQYDDGAHTAQGSVDGGGQYDFSFADWLNDRFSVEAGHTFVVTARDKLGNNMLPDGKEGRVEVKVGESNRKMIEVKVDGVNDDGILYGDSLTVRGTAQNNTQVAVMWVPDAGEAVSSGAIDTRGTAYNYTFSADSCTLGAGSVVVKYADNTAAGRQGSYAGTVNWIREAPVEEKPATLQLRSALTEDSRSIELRTEPNAGISLTVDGTQIDLDGNDRADENGNWEYPLANNEGVSLKNESKVQIEIVDASGRTASLDEITVGGSNRKDITAEVTHLTDDAFYGETLQVSGIAERDTLIRVVLVSSADNVEIGSQEIECSGRYTAEFNAAECDVTGDEGTECYVWAEYADMLAKSKSYPGTTPFLWVGHEKVEQREAKLEVKKLFEDSESIRVETEPETMVTIENLTTEQEIDSHPSDGEGRFTCDLLDLDEAYRPTQEDEIRVWIVDGYGNEKHVDVTVGEAKRKQITVRVKEAGEGDTIESETITVTGNAEAGQELLVQWLPDGEPDAADQVFATASINGWYEVTLEKDNFTEGYGSVRVTYADGLARSKAGSLEEGRLNWVQATPPPTPTPPASPTPPPTPTPTPSPTPSPTPARVTPTPPPTPTPSPVPPIPVRLLRTAEDYFGGRDQMLRNWKFWVFAAAALLLIALIVALIVYLARKAKKKREITGFTPSDDIRREGTLAEKGTERQSAPQQGGSPTTRMGPGNADYVSSGTMNMTAGGFDFGETSPNSGTIRLSPEDVREGGTGTVRISEGPQPMYVRIHETRERAGVDDEVTLAVLDEATIGRNADNDMVIHDETVSGRHLKLIRRENNLFALDLMSSNGTTLNGQRISTETILASGDRLVVGRTTLTVSFDE